MTQPNLVLIFMDDMTHWSLRSAQVEMPNLQQLRSRGTTFTEAFNQGSMIPAVCLPARQMLLSGLTVFDANESFSAVTRLGATMTGAGYDTFFTGKWHNGEEALNNDYRAVGPWAGGMLGSEDAADDAYQRPREGDAWSPSDSSNGGHWMTLPDGSIQHSSERWADAAVRFVGEDHGDDPFFLHLAFHAPHDPRQAPQEFLDRYPVDDIRMPDNFLPEHPFDNGALDIRDEYLAPSPRTAEAVRLHRSEYFAMLTHVDREIGRVLDAVAEEDSRSGRESIIVFSGDHGLALGEHGLFGKQNLYDHSIRVPLVIAGPGVPEDSTCDFPVYSGSIYPTICELIGLPVPPHVQFPSLVPTLGEDTGVQSEVFNAYGMTQRAIRRDGMKLITYSDASNDQLFNIAEDPWEKVNLIDRDECREQVAQLRGLLARQQETLHDPAARI